ncbi:hypothetical protein BpHYR1_018092 [Brachionus plicatilis]|uniref:Uncharacterized protein n=1 Tax=Brachionus plicatilis TaxID=10195 RepID=A0A3M7SKR7_BRAPC|nr:hypothetical protein BpHYR1_018092 [Brachionus plicatilis]
MNKNSKRLIVGSGSLESKKCLKYGYLKFVQNILTHSTTTLPNDHSSRKTDIPFDLPEWFNGLAIKHASELHGKHFPGLPTFPYRADYVFV